MIWGTLMMTRLALASSKAIPLSQLEHQANVRASLRVPVVFLRDRTDIDAIPRLQ